VKNRTLVLSTGLSIFTTIIILFSCKKINEATRLGDDLLPAIDNVNTFQVFLSTNTDNKKFNDTTKMEAGDWAAIGHLNDPEFGTTDANAYFTISYPTPGTYPFINKDSVKIDSVILSLSYQGTYGDTNSTQTVKVFEVDQSSGFNDTTLYKFTDPGFNTAPFPLGSKTFAVNTLNDSILHIWKGDTTKLGNVLRIPLDTQLVGRRFVNYDTSNTSNGAFRNDSIFQSVFRGLAIKSDVAAGNGGGNALTYYRFLDNNNTRLTIYFRATKNGVIDTTSVSFFHVTQVKNNRFTVGQANTVKRTEAGPYLAYLNNTSTSDDQVYIQSTPGSYATIKIPALDTFPNVVVHRAELIFTRLATPTDNIFAPPTNLFLDKVNDAGDTASVFDLDHGLQVGTSSTTYDLAHFGGFLKSDQTYRFNITRHVQKILTEHKKNYTLRVYAPLRTFLYSEAATLRIPPISVIGDVAYGRVVLTGGSYSDSTTKVRLRIVYTKIF
jgi:hypothetical protein